MINKKSESGVSLAIRKTLFSLKNDQPLLEKSKEKKFTIKVANNLEERESVFRLAYQVYLDKGYIKPNANEWLVQNYDYHPETTILIIQDSQKNIIASVTLIFDGKAKIPADKIYGNEVNILRKQNEKIVEISRLVINPEFRNSKEILVLLFNYLYIYSFHIKGYSCLAIEVNPRHTNYYENLLHFTPIGSEKPCPSVQSAPAILLYLSLKHSQDEVLRIYNNIVPEKKDRSLYNYFVNPKQEPLVSQYLKNQIIPMTAEEKTYFGLSESGLYQIAF